MIDADRGHIITYIVTQKTTSRDLNRVQRAFARELQLTQGRLVNVEVDKIEKVDAAEVRSWQVTAPTEEIKVDRG